MAALTKGRRVVEREGRIVVHPLAADAEIFAGALVVLDGGWLKPGHTAAGLVAVGVSEGDMDNSSGANGVVSANTRRWGTFRFANHGADPVARTHIGGLAYIVDDQTVAATDGAGSRSAAGKIVDLDAQGVWIEFV
ncbi:MAG: hypothetical protein EPN20_12930 [Magnetospirillum sp.]|nr:MAG: hypothetical protein EPN20_12930 [Magnetospirillum sp.]